MDATMGQRRIKNKKAEAAELKGTQESNIFCLKV